MIFMKYIIQVSLLLFTCASAMNHQPDGRLPYAQQRMIDGMQQLSLGAPLLVTGTVLAFTAAPTAKEFSSVVELITGIGASAFGCVELIHSFGNLICNEDECKDNCKKACKAIWLGQCDWKQD